MAGAVSITLLGPLEASVGGERADLGGPTPRLVLALLALAVPRSVSIDALTHAIWGDHPPASARKLIQKYVSGLRKILGRGAISTTPSGYGLAVEPDRIDAVVFQETLDRARVAQRGGQTRRAWELYEEGLGLWRGSPFAKWEDVPALVDEAHRLEELRLDALEEQIEVALALGMGQELVPVLEDLVRRHALREGLWASLMTALYRSGRQADALSAYRRLRGILGEELGIEPAPRLADLEERILLQDPALLPPERERPRGNLPTPYTSFVGRRREVSELSALLGRSPLVTLVGPGGSGKTRLGVEAARAVAGSFPDGLWFVDLVGLPHPDRLVPHLASVFGLAHEPGTSPERILLEFLASRRLLLVLDNCEHVATAAASAAEAVLSATRSVAILATSREPLGLTGEVLYVVGPLNVPDETEADPAVLVDVEAVRLFVDRAEGADPGFRLTTDVAPAVAEICRRLDGLPLAVELAARQLHVLGIDELRRGLLARLELLAAPGEPDPRHRTMEAAIEWSHRLLDDDQRRLFSALSVFPGTFSHDTVEAVCRDLFSAGATTPLLVGLVSRSLVVRNRTGEGARYRLLEPIRAYATRLASEEGWANELSRRHAEWVLELLTQHTPIVGPDERARLRRLSAEHHHFPGALGWAVEHDPELALRILVAAAEYVSMVEYRFAWVDLLTRAMSVAESAPEELQAAALAHGAAALAENFADYDSARSWAEGALALARETGDAETAAHAELALGLALRNAGLLEEAEGRVEGALGAFERLGSKALSGVCRRFLGFIHLGRGDYDAVIERCREAIATGEDIGSDWVAGKSWWLMAAAFANNGDYQQAEACAARSAALLEGFDDPASLIHVRAVQGDAARLSGGYERAEATYRECLRGFQEVGDRRCTASTLKNLGMVAIHLDRPKEAGRLLLAALERRQRLGDEGGIPECLEGLGLVYHRMGEDESAVLSLGAARRLRSETGVTAPEPERAVVESALSACQSSLGGARFTAVWANGQNMDGGEMMRVARTAFDRAVS